MKAQYLDNENAGKNAWFARRDADRTNQERAATYNWVQRSDAQRAVDLLDLAYAYSEIFINYRQKFISIKIEQPRVRNGVTRAEVESILAEKGVSKIKTAQGITYRILRVK